MDDLLKEFNNEKFQELPYEKKKDIVNQWADIKFKDVEKYKSADENTKNIIKENLANKVIKFDISDTVEKVKDYFDTSKDIVYQGNDTTKYATGNNPVAPLPDGTIPQQKKNNTQTPINIQESKFIAGDDNTATREFKDGLSPLQQDEKITADNNSVLFGTGDYENPTAEDYELGKRVVNRTNELTSNAIQSTYNLLGSIKSPMEYLGISTKAIDAQNKKRKEWFDDAAKELNNFVYEKNNLKVKPTHTWDETKKAFKKGGVFDIDAWQEAGNYILSEGVASAPDMAEMVATLPLYYASRLQESAEKRAENDGRKAPSQKDYALVAPTVIGSVMLDTFGLKAITKDVVEKVGKKALDGGFADVGKTIAKEMKDGFVVEGTTEAVQNPLERFGEEQNTKHGLSSAGTYIDDAAGGFVAGAGMGATLSGATATGTEAFNAITKEKQDAQREQFIQDTYNKDLLGGGIVLSVNDKGYVAFKEQLDTKVKDIQTKFENLIINNPDIKVPVEAVDNITLQEEVVQKAQQDGLDVSDNNGLNAIDKGFKELEAEIGGVEDVQPKAAQETEVPEEAKTVRPTIDIQRLKELEEKPDDELTLDEKFELEDLQNEVKQLQDRGKNKTDIKAENENKNNIISDANNDIQLDEVPLQTKNELFIQAQKNRKTPTGQGSNESLIPAQKQKRKLSARAEALQEASIVPIGGSEDTTAENVKKLMAQKELDSELKSYNKADIAELEREHLANKYHPVEVNRAYDFLSTDMKKIPSKQSPLTGLEARGQGELFDTKASEQYITPSWAKDVVSDTTTYADVIKAMTDAKNGDVSELYDRAMQALHKAGDPHLDNEVKRFDELSQRWDLNPIEESELKELIQVLDNHLQGEEDGTLGQRESSTAKTEAGTQQTQTEDNRAVQNTTEQGILKSRSEKESDRGISDSKADAGLEQNSAIIKNETEQGVKEDDKQTRSTQGDTRSSVQKRVDDTSVREPRGVQPDTPARDDREVSTDKAKSVAPVSDGDSGQSSVNDGRIDTQGVSTPRSKINSSETRDPEVPLKEDNFNIDDTLDVKGGLKTKFKNNIKALKIVQKIQKYGYNPTLADKKILAQYVGWGGLPNAFVKPDGTIAKGWEKEAKELQEVLDKEQYAQARRSTQDAHYTGIEIVDAIWSAVKRFGFKGGKVLEPSVGVGNFFGRMPSKYKSTTKLYGVELDGTTATIAKALYPKANIQNKGLQEVSLSNDFSLVIGNPPFGSQSIFDKNAKHLKDFSIHNYFFAKSIDALEDGGILAMVVSNGLMDAANTKAREYIGSKANLIGAIRLPNNAFSKNANTEVTTDIIFLQKRYKGEKSNLDEWLDLGEVNDTPLNKYFVKHPDMMLGKWGKYGTMYRGDSPALIAYDGEKNTPAVLLPAAIKSLASNIVKHESVLKTDDSSSKFDGDISKVRVGAMFVKDGKILRREPDKDAEIQVSEVNTKLNSKNEEVAYTPKEIEKIKAMIDVVSVADELRKLQLDTTATPTKLKTVRAELNGRYDAFVKKYGYLNSATNMRLFEDDVRSPFLLALEKNYDKGVSAAVAKKTGQIAKPAAAQKADIFTKRTQSPYMKPSKADNAKDALTISLGEYGEINLDYMQELTGKSEDELISDLSGYIFEDVNDGWVTREEYLSGDVKTKYEQTSNPEYKAALQTVIPKDIDAVDISVTLGSTWIPIDDMKDFVEYIAGSDTSTVTLSKYNAKWAVNVSPSSAASTKWGTKRRSVQDILTATMNLSQIQVKDNVGTSAQPQMVVNAEETTAAQEKQEQLKDEFKEWIWRDAGRRERLAAYYNETFNRKATRTFDGTHVNFVGKSDSIDLRQHQKNGTWRVLQGGTVLFDHTVGTGKTFTAIASVMELRRTNKAKKPLVIVPNHLTGQWGKEWIELYPSANILVPSKKDFTAARRKILMSKIATGDYDAIIIAHSQLTKIQNDVAFEKRFIKDEINRVQEAIDMLKAEDGKSRSVKDAEKSKERLVAKLDKLNDVQRDNNLDFSELGIDSLIVDEAHEFKNLTYTTGLQKVAGLGNPQGSKKAFDLFIKTQNMLEKTGGNNLVFLTGTPISNTIAEMFTMQRYLSYDKLKEQNLDVFDAWVKQYAEIVSDWELSPSGKYKLNTRLSKFNNMPELITEYKQFADVVTREDIPALPIPKVKGGKPQNIVVDRSEEQAQYIGVADENGRYPEGSLVYRSEHLPKGKPKKGDDNMLKIMGEARKVALDMRLIDPNAQDNPQSKVNLTVNNSYEIYKKWNSKKGAQLIFCDLSTPKGAVAKEKAKIEALIKKAEDGDEKANEELEKLNPDDLDALNSEFSVYDDIKAKLIAKGIPANEVAFIHDANTDLQKQELFNKVKSGKVRILLGSTSKMGAGMNVQDKLVALHHLDVPWRPSDLEQREGRIIRQGNEFYKADPKKFQIEIFRYATKNTLDSMMWQTIETKAKFIEQLRAGNITQREVEDVSAEAVSAGEMKALSSGNPLILEDMVLKKEIKKLEALKKNHDRTQYDIETKVKRIETEIKESDATLKAYAADIKLSKKMPKEFGIEIDGVSYDKREDAGKKLIGIIMKMPTGKSKLVGNMGDFKIYMEKTPQGLSLSSTGIVTISANQDYEFDFNIAEQSYEGLTLKIGNTIKKIADKSRDYEMKLEDDMQQLPLLKEQLGEFKYAKDLDVKKIRSKEINAELRKKDDDKQEEVPHEIVEDAKESFMKIPSPRDEMMTEQTNSYARAHGFDDAGRNYIPTYSVTGIPARSETGTIQIGSKEVTLPSIDKPLNADSVRVYLSDIVGSRLYEAKLHNTSALGVYKKADSSIRLKSYSDVEIMAHEMAHYLDLFYNNKTKSSKGSFFRSIILKNKEEVKALSYTTKPKEVLKEGFAEFVRGWLTNYNELQLVAPDMIKDFEKLLAKDKSLNKKMHTLQEKMHSYYYQGAGVRKYIGAELDNGAKKIQQSQKELAKDMRQKLIDSLHSIKRIEADVRGDVAGDALYSPYKMLQLVNGASSIMYSAMNIGVPILKENGDISYSGKPLNKIFESATKHGPERVRLLGDYLVAKRADELMQQGRENLIKREDIAADLKLAEIYPEFATIFDEYQEFNDAMLDFYVGMDLITPEQKETFQEMNKNYVPFNRVQESLDNGSVVVTSALGKRLTGGTHSLGNIMENIVDGVSNNIKQALISRGKSSLYKMLEDSGMGGVYATRVSTESKLVKDTAEAQAKKVATVMAMLGLTITKDGMVLSGKSESEEFYDVKEIEDNLLLNPKTLEVWTHGNPPKGKGGSFIDSVIIDGKKVYFETKDAALVDALSSFSSVQHSTFVKGLMSIKNIMTWNITNNPLFYLTNFARDTVSGGVLSKNNFIPLLSSMSGAYHFITKSKTYKEFMASGAGYGTRRTALGGENEAMQMLDVARSFNILERAISAMEYGADIFEYGTRIGDFALAQKAGKSNMQSAYEAREVSTDFAIKGSEEAFRTFMATVPFMKAGILGIDKTARRIFSLNAEMKLKNAVKFRNNMGEIQKHKLKIYATGGLIMGATLALWLANRDDDRYKKLTRDAKLMYWHIFIGDKHYKIPRPYDIGFAFSSIPEIIADGIYTKEGKDAAHDFLWSLKTMFSIGDVSGLFQPVLEDMTNKNWTGSPIIPSNLQNLDDLSDQYFNTTPLLYKTIGKKIGASPIKMQHYVDGYLGLTAKMIEEATENILWNTRDWGERPFSRNALEFMTYRFVAPKLSVRTKYSEKYYELMQKANAVKASFDKKKKEAYKDNAKDVKEYVSDKEKQKYIAISAALNKYNRALSKVKVEAEHIMYDKKLSKSDKEQQIEALYEMRDTQFKKIIEQVQNVIDDAQGGEK